MQSDFHFWHLWRETNSRLDSLAKQVREGLAVDEASNFARWLQFSGVHDLLKGKTVVGQLVLDPDGLKRKANDLIYECGQWYALHERSNTPRDAYVSVSKLDALEKEMRLMREQIARLSPPVPETSAVVPATALHVIQGGAS